MAEAIFRPPPPLDLANTEGNLAETFKDWKRELEVFMDASGASEKSKKAQVAVILNLGGSSVLRAFDQFVFAKAEDKEDPTIVLAKIKEYCDSQQNEVLQTFKFWNLPLQEPFDCFLTDLRRKADSCNFTETDRMIRDKIVFTVTGKLQERLLRESGLDLKKAIDVCRASEVSSKHSREMQAGGNLKKLDKVESQRTRHKSTKYDHEKSSHTNPKSSSYESKPSIKNCNFCGGDHGRSKYKCPAWGGKCDYCHG